MAKKSATKRRDGRYMAYAVLPSGRKAVYAGTEEDAVRMALLLEEEAREYEEKVKFTFSGVYSRWFLLKLEGVKPQTADRIEYTYNKYFRDDPIGSMDIRRMDSLFCLEWLLSALNRQPVTYKEFQRIMQLFAGVYGYGVDFLGMPDSVSWARVRRNIPRNKFAVSARKEYAVPESSIAAISGAVRDGMTAFRKPSATALLYCNFYLGLRIGELASLRWSDVDFGLRCVHVTHTETRHHERGRDGTRTGNVIYDRQSLPKTSAGVRTVPLVQEAYDILLLIRRYHLCMGYRSGYVAYDGKDTRAVADSLRKTLRSLCRSLGLPEFNSHLIRKTVATRLHNAGVATRQVSDLLGHSDISTTERSYIISMEGSLDLMRKCLEEALAVSGGSGFMDSP